MSSTNNIGIVILAAGSSSRLGKPKQLLRYHNKNLLQHAIDVAAGSDGDSIVVVLGANTVLISNDIYMRNAHVVENKEWEEGMASSVRIGLNALLQHKPAIDAVIFMVCDQPFISSSILSELIATQQNTGKPIVACNYGETIGPPALFHKSFFPELMKLKGDAGARRIIQQNMDEVATVLFLQGKIDIDTKEDYEALENS